MPIQKFTDLLVWQEAHILTIMVYKLIKKFPREEIYGLSSQIKRAVISIESCIAEGFCRYHYKDRLNFYYDSRGSVGEVQSQLFDALDLEFINKTDFDEAYHQSEKVAGLLGGLIKSTNLRVK